MLYVWYIMAHTMICKRHGVKTLAWIYIECESMMIDHVSSISTLFKLYYMCNQLGMCSEESYPMHMAILTLMGSAHKTN